MKEKNERKLTSYVLESLIGIEGCYLIIDKIEAAKLIEVGMEPFVWGKAPLDLCSLFDAWVLVGTHSFWFYHVLL